MPRKTTRVRLKPFLKWAGGKAGLIEQYEPHLPKKISGRYFEPFLGGGALFFHLRPEQAVLSDVNEELVNCYLMVRDAPEALIAAVVAHRDRHDEDHYYEVRANVPSTKLDRAARFIYLNRTCYNGLWRVNSKGGFNVPLGRYKRPLVSVEAMISSASQALVGKTIEVRPFEQVLDHAKRGDVVYFDPPYQPLSRTSSFTSYSKTSFSEDDQRRLAHVFEALTKKRVKALLSNSDHPLIRRLYASKRYKVIEISARRSINSKAQHRGPINELLIRNY